MGKYEIVRPSEGQLRDYCAIASEAFGMDPALRYAWSMASGIEHVRVALNGGVVAAGLKIKKMGHWFNGKRVEGWGIGGVATAVHHRGEGLAKGLMADMLREARERGVAVSALYPATSHLYRTLGYECAGVYQRYELPIRDLQVDRAPGRVEPITGDQVDVLKVVYERSARQHNGFMARPEYFWDIVFNAEKHHGYVLYCDEEPEGYVIYNRRDMATGDERDVVAINDMHAVSPAAGRLALRLLASLSTINNAARWYGAPDELLYWLLPEQRIKPIYREHWMLRLIDVEAAFRQRGYPPITGELHLEVADDVLAENAGRYVLTLRRGEPTVQRGGSGRIRCDVRALAAVYTGFASPQRMQLLGRLDGPDEDVALLSAAFAGAAASMVDHF